MQATNKIRAMSVIDLFWKTMLLVIFANDLLIANLLIYIYFLCDGI